MPPIASEKWVFDELFDRVGPSVVVIGRYRGNDFVDFGTGFIISSYQNQVLICSHESILREGDNLFVRFHDGVRKKATLFARNIESEHVVLKATSVLDRPCVHFTAYPVRRQNIFTMAAVEAADGIGLMSGTVSIPDCTAVRPNGTRVDGNKIFFAMSCPLSGPKVPEDTEGRRLVGAAVFNMKGLVIGTIDHVDSESFDIKYSRKTSSFLNNMECFLKNIDQRISFSKGKRGGFTEGAGTSRQGATSAGSKTKKRGRDDPPSGGTRGLCVDQLKVMEVARIRDDMNVGRREAMRRHLVRLVTRESDGRRTVSPSSLVINPEEVD